MRRTVVAVLGVLAGGALALSPAASAAAPPASGSPGCGGLIVAEFNHASAGASGNPQASAGPGYFLRQGTSDAVQGVKGAFCP